VSFYLDASVVVALLTDDPHAARADAFFRNNRSSLVVSDFAAAEFSSVIARRVRTGEIARSVAEGAFVAFNLWMARNSRRVEIIAADIRAAETFLRQLAVNLRTPDALNLAIAQHLGATLVTFDLTMAASARMLGLPVAAA
jgi:uncharacterized protein